MIIEYKIDEKDILIYQLYGASKSERIKKKRNWNKIFFPLVNIILSLLYFLKNNYQSVFIFLILGIFWYFIYPLWEKQHYIRHYKGYINENFKNIFGKKATLEINNDFFLAKDEGSESKVMTSEFEEICEISSIIFIKLNNGHSFILPKEKIANIDNLKIFLKELSSLLKIKYVIDEKWEWS